jgi:hypothetical protein
MKNGLYDFCVSTIVDRHKLEQFALRGSGIFTEGRAWKTAKRLLDEARRQGKDMPVILSDAAFNSEPLWLWGVLRELNIEDDQTTIQLTAIQRVRGNHGRQDLVLRSSGRQIKPKYIRPYAICQTPPFLNR